MKTAKNSIIDTEMMNLPEHGGDLRWASTRFNIPEPEWIDLSTGISPWHYPIPVISENYYRQLPHRNSEIISAASAYYLCNTSNIVPTPGSQSTIELIPKIVDKGDVLLPKIGYKEHEKQWQKEGHRCHFYSDFDELHRQSRNLDKVYAVLINPNNPSAQLYSRSQTLLLQSLIQKKRNSLLIIDEAFMDLHPGHSLTSHKNLDQTLILRSFGKFFGLAGIRLGFAIGDQAYINDIRDENKLWKVNGPAQFIAHKAFQNSEWIRSQRKRITLQAGQFSQFLKSQFPKMAIHNGQLFISVTGNALSLYEAFITLASNGVLSRYIPVTDSKDTYALLRFSLPGEHYDPITKHLKSILGK